jgi:hypothetical protein
MRNKQKDIFQIYDSITKVPCYKLSQFLVDLGFTESEQQSIFVEMNDLFLSKFNDPSGLNSGISLIEQGRLRVSNVIERVYQRRMNGLSNPAQSKFMDQHLIQD